MFSRTEILDYVVGEIKNMEETKLVSATNFDNLCKRVPESKKEANITRHDFTSIASSVGLEEYNEHLGYLKEKYSYTTKDMMKLLEENAVLIESIDQLLRIKEWDTERYDRYMGEELARYENGEIVHLFDTEIITFMQDNMLPFLQSIKSDLTTDSYYEVTDRMTEYYHSTENRSEEYHFPILRLVFDDEKFDGMLSLGHMTIRQFVESLKESQGLERVFGNYKREIHRLMGEYYTVGSVKSIANHYEHQLQINTAINDHGGINLLQIFCTIFKKQEEE